MIFTYRDLFDNDEAYGPRSMVDWIVERSRQDSTAPADAGNSVVEELSENDIRLWATGMFEVAMSACVRRAQKELGERFGPSHGPHGMRYKQLNKPSWRADLMVRPGSVWDYVLPVGGSGVMKRLGDWNKCDIEEVACWYGGMADRMVYRQTAFERLADRLPNDEITIEQALEDHTLYPSHVRLLRERVDDFEAGQGKAPGMAPPLQTLEGEEGFEELQEEDQTAQLLTA